jgi:hypothetical protein
MKFKYAFVALALMGFSQGPARAQTVNEYNYKQSAFCTETVINGKVFSTFGEGPCPPGSRRTMPSRPYNSYDVNQQNLARTQAAVNAIGGMQQAVLAWGQARGQRIRQESARIMSTYYMDIPNSDLPPGQTRYQSLLRVFPDAGSIASAEAGRPLVYVQSGFYSDCFVSQDAYEKKYMGWVHVIKAGEPACKISADDKGFTPSYWNYSRNKDRESDPFVYEQFIDMSGQTYSICIKDMGIKFGCSKEIPGESVRMFTGFVGTRGSERGVVLYQGVKDGLLRFSYSPANASTGAPATEISVNPTESRDVTIGDIHFEIVEWSDTAIAVKMK